MVSVTGLGSGLDIDSLVTQLVAAERAPQENRLLRREADISSELSAFGTLKGALANLQNSLSALTKPETFSARTVNSSDSQAVAATVGEGAVPGSYSIVVSELAQAQSVASMAFADSDSVIGEGSFTLRFGTLDTSGSGPSQVVDSFSPDAGRDPLVISIDSSNNTLGGLRDSINELDAGVSASIVNDASGARLLLSSTDTGVSNGFTIDIADSGDNSDVDDQGLSRLAFNTSAANLEQSLAARDASFTFNGLELSSSSNSVKDVVEGLDLELKSVQTQAVSVGVTENRSVASSGIDRFITAYNQFVNIAAGLTRYNADSGQAGALQGDFSARAVVSQLRTAIGQSAGLAGEGPDSLLELGIETAADGTLSVDREKLTAALEGAGEHLSALFTDSDKGLASGLDKLLDGLLGDTGLLNTRTDSLEESASAITASREALDRRMISVEERYSRQFNALDILLAEVQSTGSFLTQQLASIPLPGSSSNS